MYADDKLEVRLLSREDPLARWEETEALLQRVLELFPATTVAARKQKAEPFALATARRMLVAQDELPRGLSLADDGDRHTVQLTSYEAGNLRGFSVHASAPLDRFLDEEASAELAAILAALCRRWPPLHGWAHSLHDRVLANDPTVKERGVPKQIHQAYWWNAFSSTMVKKLGRARVTSAPAFRVEDLPEGGALLMTRPTLADVLDEAGREAQARALAHLRPDVRYEDALAALQRRSALLAPLPPHPDPDVAELVRYALTVELVKNRAALGARLLALRPRVSEQRPAAEVPPSDVDDVERAVRGHRKQAEDLAAGLHADIPGLVDHDTRELPALDRFFYQRDYPNNTTRSRLDSVLLPMLGAYLGRLLEEHLGGRWHPRRSLDETAVIVGDRAWLPFLRARHYLASRQSVIEYSMTHFYRDAERSAPSD